MTAPARFFLRAPHWQLFIFSMAVWIFGSVAVLNIVWPLLATELPARIMILLGLVTGLQTACFLAWFGVVGQFLYKIIQPQLRIKIKFFWFALCYSLAYSFLVPTVLFTTNTTVVAAIVPLHMLAFFCLMYILRFVAKSLVLAESGKPLRFEQYASVFFLAWFYFIGIWFIQPRINRLAQNKIA